MAVRAAASEDVLVRTLSANGEVAVLCVTGTGLVAEAAARHRSAPTATAAMGRSLIGTLLLGAYRKDDEVTQVTFRGDGPLGQMTTIATTRGTAKVAVENPAADPPLRPDGKLNVGAAVGRGIMSVVRSHPLMKEPYTGLVPIYTGAPRPRCAHAISHRSALTPGPPSPQVRWRRTWRRTWLTASS